jgi:hypothetical protein
MALSKIGYSPGDKELIHRLALLRGSVRGSFSCKMWLVQPDSTRKHVGHVRFSRFLMFLGHGELSKMRISLQKLKIWEQNLDQSSKIETFHQLNHAQFGFKQQNWDLTMKNGSIIGIYNDIPPEGVLESLWHRALAAQAPLRTSSCNTLQFSHRTFCSCWTDERLHREIEQYALQNPNASAGFEKSIVVDALYLQLTEVQ